MTMNATASGDGGAALGRVHYAWQRYWCAIDATYYLDQRGYVQDRAEGNPSLVRFSEIAETRAVVLLGEPGMGKTNAMQDERSRIADDVRKSGGELLWVDLKEFGSEDRLVRTVFEGNEVARWLQGGHDLHLYLDSLDEALLRIETLAAIILSFLRKWPLQRLVLRIACRTADWPRLLGDGLQSLTALAPIRTVELAGLTRRDVEVAAEARGVDPEMFCRLIERRGAVPLAIKPVTLELLLRTFATDGDLPSTQRELYLRGCRVLCSEPPPGAAELDTAQRVAIAARIAATLIFGGKAAVFSGPNLGDVADSDVPIEELAGGTEGSTVGVTSVTERAIREVLRTSLFSARGTTDRLGFAHQTLAEFLAAYYIRDIPLAQALGLIVHPGDPEGRVIPQLREPAAWVASVRVDVFRELARCDPSVLLRSDAAGANDDDRKRLVAALLNGWSEGKLFQRGWEVVQRWSVLDHAGLATQLRPYIRDKNKNALARLEAIDIAEATEQRALEQDLLRVALDQGEALVIRVNAAYAVERIGTDGVKAKLSPLLDDGADSNDELLGVALRALWPKHLSTSELFKVLRPARNRNFVGAYQLFLQRELAEQLPADDLPIALDWAISCMTSGDRISSFEGVIDGILTTSLHHVDRPRVLELLAKGLFLRHRHHYQFFDRMDEKVLSPLLTRDVRRQLVAAMVRQMTDPERDRHDLLGGQPRLIDADDVVWLIEEGTKDPASRAWPLLVQFTLDPTNRRQTEALYEASQLESEFNKLFGADFDAVVLDSETAASMRKSYELWNRHMKKKPRPSGPTPGQRVEAQLAASEAGQLEAWWRLNRELMLKPEDTQYPLDNFFGAADLQKFPGWGAADDGVRARIVRAAKRCITDFEPRRTWIGTGTVSEADLAGYRAFRLLRDLEPSFLDQITLEVWKKWGPVLLAAPVNDGAGAQASFVKMSYPQASAEVIDALSKLIDRENTANGTIFALKDLGTLWDERIANLLRTKLRDKSMKAESLSRLLEILIDHDDPQAVAFALSKASTPGRKGTLERTLAFTCADLLLRHSTEKSWPTIWPLIRKRREFGKELALRMADLHDLRAGRIKLTEEQAADFFIWLYRQFPPKEDPAHEGFLPPRAMVSDFRDSFITNLRERGTRAAVDALRRIQRELNLSWMGSQVLQAERLFLARSWNPPSPAQIVALIADTDRRLIESGKQLVALIREALTRFEQELQGDQPAVVGLWDEVGRSSYRPKPEVVLADAIARFLRTDLKGRGLAALREVEIRRGYGGKGERTDVYVTAVRKQARGDALDLVPAVVEVKASWSPDLFTAMTGQLAQRYLKRSRASDGLFAVGWYACRSWAKSDRRRRRAGQHARAEARLKAEATDLEGKGFNIAIQIVDCELR